MKKSDVPSRPPRVPLKADAAAARRRQHDLLLRVNRINRDYSRRIAKVLPPAKRRKLTGLTGPEAARCARQLGVNLVALRRLKKARLKEISRLVAGYVRSH